MNKGIVFHYLSKALLLSSALFLVPALVSLYYREYFFMLIFLGVGGGMALASLPGVFYRPRHKYMFAREGMVIAALMWIIFSAVGALPFYCSGSIPHYIDALFESVSGFTTTGSSILTDIEALPRGILFWRSFTHWVGGMGVLVLAIAILPSSGNALYLMQAECPGPQVGKLVPKGKNSALYLYLIYGALTFITIVLLFTGGMPLFDSVCHGMGIAGTGGFGIKNDGLSYYNSPYLDGVVTVTMLLFGVNFTLYYYMLIRRFREVRKNTELRVYFSIVAISTALIMLNIRPIYHSVGKCFRYAVFQVASIITSTGFATADYNQWPLFSQMLLILLMAAGALLETVFIMQSYRRRCVRSVIFKTLASACFVLLAMQCIRIRGTSDYARLVFWGLVCGLLGDALLALRFLWKKTHDVFFIAGTLAFFAGHIFYILAILKLAPDAWQYAIPLALIALGVAGFYSNAKQVKAGKILPLGIIYIGEVLFVAACALSGALQTSSRALFLFFIGGLCFSLSDNMLVVLSFGTNDNPYRNAVLHVLYYMAQVFIAVSILFL